MAVHTAGGFDAAETQAAVREFIAALSVLPHVIAVTSLYDIPGSISDSGTIARFEVRYDLPTFEIEEDAVHELFALREERSTDGFQIELTGSVAFVGEQEEPGESEIIGLIATAISLLIAFGSVGAMGLPIITALGGLVPGFMIIGIASRFVDMASFTPQFASMIGIGVGIDYALLIVTRFREAKGVGMSTDDAVGGILKKCVNSEAMYPLSEQDGLEAQEGRYTADEEGKHWEQAGVKARVGAVGGLGARPSPEANPGAAAGRGDGVPGKGAVGPQV